MGVRGLQSFLESHCAPACYSVNIGKVSADYQRKTGKPKALLVVDGMSCLRKFYGKLLWICGGQWVGFIDHIESFIKVCHQHEIHTVFFFDGATPERKRETWIHRRIENLKDVETYFKMVKNNKELEHGKHFFLPTGLAAFCPLILKDVLGCEVYTVEDECDKDVAEYAKRHGAMGILGQDSDYTIYSTAPYYFSVNHLNMETLDTVMYDRSALAKQLNLKLDQLPMLSCLIGNDVISQDQLLLFHKQFVKEGSHHHHGKYHNRPPPEILIPKVAQFISNQFSMDQMNAQLPQVSRAVFRDETMVPSLMEGIKMYQLDVTNADKYVEMTEEELSQHSTLEQIELRHMHTQLGRHLYALIRGEPYESSTTLEDYSSTLPSGALVYRQLRARVYYLIQKTTKGEGNMNPVIEWCMYNGSTLKEGERIEPEALPDGSPSMEELWEGDEDLRWKTLFDCLHPMLHTTIIRTLPTHLITPVCVIFYMQCTQARPILKEWEVNALIAVLLSPIRADLTQIRALSLPRIDARAVHVAAIFMKGLVNFYLLNATCGFPLSRKDVVPWQFWDGKVFQFLYLRSKAGAKIEELVDRQEELMKQFLVIKELLREYTVIPVIKKPEPTSADEETPQGSPKKGKKEYKPWRGMRNRGHLHRSNYSSASTLVVDESYYEQDSIPSDITNVHERLYKPWNDNYYQPNRGRGRQGYKNYNRRYDNNYYQDDNNYNTAETSFYTQPKYDYSHNPKAHRYYEDSDYSAANNYYYQDNNFVRNQDQHHYTSHQRRHSSWNYQNQYKDYNQDYYNCNAANQSTSNYRRSSYNDNSRSRGHNNQARPNKYHSRKRGYNNIS